MYLSSCVAVAIGRDVFRPNTNTIVEVLMQIQSTFLSTRALDPVTDLLLPSRR